MNGIISFLLPTTGIVHLTAPSFINNAVNINRAAESGGLISPYTWIKNLDNSNSNFKSFVENLPDKLGYKLKIVVNPLGNVSGLSDFIYADTTFDAKVKIEIPLSLATTSLTLADTVSFKLEKNELSKDINKGTLTLLADNGFPFSAKVQLYMLSASNNIIDSLFVYSNYIDAALVDGSLRVSGKKLSKLIIPVDQTKLNKLYTAHKMKIVATFNTVSNPQYVKIYSNYTIDFKLLGDFDYHVNIH